MKSHGQAFLQELANLPTNTFENRFSDISRRLGLGATLERNELTLLYEAALCATLLNIAINAPLDGEAKPRPKQEANRLKFETAFMTARDILYASAGWQNLPAAEREVLRKIFLNVFIAEQNLAH